ncbi:MAG: acetate--CoA ligase [Thermoprotei archaeon]|jgi:acetyl-CoA synthetase
MSEEVTLLGEALPFDEKIELNNWRSRHVSINSYLEYHKKTIDDIEGYWGSIAKELEWFSPWEKVLEPGDYLYVYKWFKGGKINLSYLALDKHVKNWKKNKVAFIWESEPVDSSGNPKEVKKFTYYDLWKIVNKVAYILTKNFGLKKGDKMALYLPMIPELPIFMLAASRLGITYTVVFSGFTAENLAARINDLGATLLVTADGFYRRGRIIKLKEVADKAVNLAPGIKNVIVVKRLGLDVSMIEGRDWWLDDLVKGVPHSAYIEPEPLESEHPLYVLYTSGTTGKPKGIIHDNGGYAVLLHATMKQVFDIRDDDVYYCTADIGWVTGHSYIVYGPLIEGATTIMYEGTPDFPEPDRFWSIVERYGVTVFYTTPTAVRMLMKFGDEYVKRHDLSSLRLIHSVGEPINPSAWRWLFEVVGGKRCPVGSTWWMTETGGILISHAPGLMLTPLKPGTNGLPLPGIDADIVDEDGNPVPPGKKGFLIIRKPWPGMPGPPTGMWGDPERYRKVYFERFPGKGYFLCGDYAVKDKDGYIWVAGRADEVLKVAGHRIGTYELESVLVSHKVVAEAAVTGVPDPIKGEVPVAFVVLKQGVEPNERLIEELKSWIREKHGPISVPANIFFVNKLPKTRSGKIMRRLIKAVATGTSLGDITTLEDETAVEEIKNAYEELVKGMKGSK